MIATIEPTLNGCLATCEGCENDFEPVHDETLCRQCTDRQEEEHAWIRHGLPNCGMTKRELFRLAYQKGREEA